MDRGKNLAKRQNRWKDLFSVSFKILNIIDSY